VVRLAARFAGRVVCVSEDSKQLSEAEGIPRSKLAVIRNGIDTTRFAFRGPFPGGPVVMVGRLVAGKGVDTLLRAVELVVGRYPDFRLEIAGDGEVRPGLEALTAELGLSAFVRFLGTVQDVPGLLARSSSLVLPSLSEGISLTLLEAMARGLPVVATRVGGNPEVVEDGVTGRLVPARDAGALAQALVRVWSGADPGAEMGRAGRARVERLFDIRQMVADYESLYRRLIRRASVVA
jgi:glycosyltransferase involved in cell wall biosynthesis